MRLDFKQEIFTKVKNHLLTQNERSMNESELNCAYRGVGDLKCAAGVLIPDNDYDIRMEGCALITDGSRGGRVPVATKFFIDSGYTNSEIDLIKELQYVHDAYSVSSWEPHLKRIAENHGLNF